MGELADARTTICYNLITLAGEDLTTVAGEAIIAFCRDVRPYPVPRPEVIEFDYEEDDAEALALIGYLE